MVTEFAPNHILRGDANKRAHFRLEMEVKPPYSVPLHCLGTAPAVAGHPVNKGMGRRFGHPIDFWFFLHYLSHPMGAYIRKLSPLSPGTHNLYFASLEYMELDINNMPATRSVKSRDQNASNPSPTGYCSVPPSRHVLRSPRSTMLPFNVATKREHAPSRFFVRVLNAGPFRLYWLASLIPPRFSLLVRRKRFQPPRRSSWPQRRVRRL